MIGQVMLMLFVIVVVGYIAGKLEYMGGAFDKKLSKIVIDITCPALILSSAMTGELPDRHYILPLLGISALTYALLTGVALLLPRFLTKKKDDEGAVGFALMFGNVGFMGYPNGQERGAGSQIQEEGALQHSDAFCISDHAHRSLGNQRYPRMD